MMREKLMREAKYREYEAEVQAERRSRQARENEFAMEQILAEEERLKAAEVIAASRRIELEKKEKTKVDIERENMAVLDEQKQQEKLEKELCDIEIQIGTIMDMRNARKKKELEELEELDKKNFKLKQAMRSSKVKQ